MHIFPRNYFPVVLLLLHILGKWQKILNEQLTVKLTTKPRLYTFIITLTYNLHMFEVVDN